MDPHNIIIKFLFLFDYWAKIAYAEQNKNLLANQAKSQSRTMRNCKLV